MKSISTKVMAGIFGCVIVIFIAWFAINSNLPESKYGSKAVEDAKGAIFTADQYLDGSRTKREYEIQMIKYGNSDVKVGDKTYDIYDNIKWMQILYNDADILKYRNELAGIIGEKKR